MSKKNNINKTILRFMAIHGDNEMLEEEKRKKETPLYNFVPVFEF